ncbi:beta-galactosidase [Fulvitalea axinellae]|uniref:Beta-galactosidase n=1 Tax=Fulvitalea axinellae TaxID=1182444 RepID=A0AAU9CY54_9BACT|nr:beta-galactosidase [Fulvitalea axinellae]
MFCTRFIKKIGALKPLALAALAFALGAGQSQAETVSDTLVISPKKGPEFSTAGFFKVDGGGREVHNFNVGWRYAKGDVKGAENVNHNDADWEIVSLPHGLELLPVQASGCKNYQGPAWYRKRFEVPASMKGKKIIVHFEGIMGKSEVWVNGQPVTKHLGGFLPVIADITDVARFGGTNVIAVKADNSDDPNFPPGKPQENLDFSYFGGVYRDAWLISSDKLHITNANRSDKVAGGGVIVHFENFSEKMVTVVAETEVFNESAKSRSMVVESALRDRQGKIVGKARKSLRLAPGKKGTVKQIIKVKTPELWHPDRPYLYDLLSSVKAGRKTVDGIRNRVGIRKIEFRGKDGFYLNGKPFEDKLIGANRHQDFAYIGNALPNSLHWRDVKKLRDVGMRVIRSAHYPQDPAFMDACDELGMFMIVPTPGWQFFNWKNKKVFVNLVYNDIRQMVRRDRNHASILLWEPILNETHYPEDFAQTVHNIVHEEYPFQGAYTSADHHAKGKQYFDVLFAHPIGKESWEAKNYDMPQTVFTREWGDNVDNWSSHNSTSRVARDWGEQAQLVQALHYANPSYGDYFTCFERLYRTPRQHFGGALWHSFDHQRGYHPDPFFGGVMDAFRQPKFSYHMFASQTDPSIKLEQAESGPMVYIAHEMSPVSGADVVVFSNCEEVRLTAFGKVIATKKVKDPKYKMPHPPVVFKDVFHFMDLKKLTRGRKYDKVNIKAEGLIGGKVVTTMVRKPSYRASKIILKPDFNGAALTADGSDIVTVVAYITDQDGTVKRLSEERVKFSVSGEGELIHDESIASNPRRVEWGTAPALIRATTKAGKITIKASIDYAGKHVPMEGELVIESVSPAHNLLYTEEPDRNFYANKSGNAQGNGGSEEVNTLKKKLRQTEYELRQLKLKTVEKQQSDFEGNVKGDAQ